MGSVALFAGLIVDESGRPAEVTAVGQEAHYVVTDAGFRFHVPAERVDRTVLMTLRAQILENKELVSEQAMKMLGQEDLFTKAMIDASLQNIDEHLDKLMQSGLPENARLWLGMLGFRVVVNYHGEVVRLEQPGAPDGED